MIKKLFKDSIFHIQYWYLKELLRAIKSGSPLVKILKYYPEYMASNLDYGKSPIKLGIPWITFEAIAYLDTLMSPEMKVFEFGSGGSTKFFTKRVQEVHSIEHDEKWYDLVKKDLSNASNLNLKLVKGEQTLDGKNGVVLDEDKETLDYRIYSETILNFENEYFDLILIDGKARNASIKNSLEKLKQGGVLIVDNSQRQTYKDSINKLKNWLEFKSFGPTLCSKRFTETTFFRKPFNHV